MPTVHRRATKRAQQLRNNATPAERLLWRHLRRRQLGGWKFSRQMPVGPFICDFLCREVNLIVEVDGGQHCESKRDEARTAWLERQGYRVVRYWNNEVRENLEGVLIDLKSLIGQAHPPAPSRMREGEQE
ncbi:MAG: endonuclease domain-containing protein [Sphingomicrobium sp.]|nr:endonuclease domain-containing protein [Sphingomonadales bacterium]